MSGKPTPTSSSDGVSPSAFQSFYNGLTERVNTGGRLVGEITYNIYWNSPQIYGSGGLAYCVVKLLPIMQANPLHAAIFVGTAVLVHSVIDPLFKHFMQVDDKSKGWRNAVIICNTLALTAVIATIFSLKIAVAHGLGLTIASYMVVESVLKLWEPKKV